MILLYWVTGLFNGIYNAEFLSVAQSICFLFAVLQYLEKPNYCIKFHLYVMIIYTIYFLAMESFKEISTTQYMIEHCAFMAIASFIEYKTLEVKENG